MLFNMLIVSSGCCIGVGRRVEYCRNVYVCSSSVHLVAFELLCAPWYV